MSSGAVGKFKKIAKRAAPDRIIYDFFFIYSQNPIDFLEER